MLQSNIHSTTEPFHKHGRIQNLWILTQMQRVYNDRFYMFLKRKKKLSGDNDPVDVVELSAESFAIGSIKQVKILGTYAMIDEGKKKKMRNK